MERYTGLLACILAAFLLAACPGTPPGGQLTGPATNTPGSAEPAKPRPDAAIAEAQRTLGKLGYDAGPVDGFAGDRTRNALRLFQRDNGRPQTGNADSSTLEILRAVERRTVGIVAGRLALPLGDATRRPKAETGDVHVYSNGSVEAVIRVDSDRIWWNDADSAETPGFVNFLLPRWQRGGNAPKLPDSAAAVSALWPISRNAPVTFTTAPQQDWRCQTETPVRLAVPAGVFDTLRISCQRHPPSASEWQRRTWYYAPGLGTYVRRIDRTGDGRNVAPVDLMAVRPGMADWPPAARAGLDWAVIQMLDAGVVGVPSNWSSTGVADGFDLIVTGKAAVPDMPEDLCLSYLEQRTTPGRQRSFPGVACRDPDTGRWTIPYLAPNAAGQLPEGR